MSLSERILSRECTLAVVGLGYVGMPLAVAFAKKGLRVIGYDLSEAKIAAYKSGIDPTHEVGNEAIRATTMEFTNDEVKSIIDKDDFEKDGFRVWRL